MLSTLPNRRIPRLAIRMAAVLLLLRWARGDAAAEDSAASPDRVVVVELFTSQGCSSCPPADRLLTSLGARSGARVVPLAFHVDFWNSSGWKDPFSQAEWTRRQAAYERVLGIKNVYTPQAIVDGSIELIGSNAEALDAAMATTAARPAATIALRLEPADADVLAEVDVDVPESLRRVRLDLMFAVYEVGLSTPVGRGENGGRTLQNDYVVRSLRRGDRLSAGGARSHHAVRLRIDKQWNRARLGVAVFLQDPESLRISGARAAPLEGGGATVASSTPR
jgi:hypothetical protein